MTTLSCLFNLRHNYLPHREIIFFFFPIAP